MKVEPVKMAQRKKTKNDRPKIKLKIEKYSEQQVAKDYSTSTISQDRMWTILIKILCLHDNINTNIESDYEPCVDPIEALVPPRHKALDPRQDSSPTSLTVH